MRKLLLSIFTLAFAFTSVNAQSIQLSNSTAIPIYGSTADFFVAAHVDVTNIGNTTINVMCEVIQTNLAPGHDFRFCWGPTCYLFGDSTCSKAESIAPGAVNNTFIGDIVPAGLTGTSFLTFNFYDSLSPSNATNITFEYRISVTGIEDNDSKASITAAHPNPSDKFTTIGYNLKGDIKNYQMEIYSILGTKIASFNFKEKNGLMIVPTESLQSGVYFCTLKQGSKPIATQKLIVSHK